VIGIIVLLMGLLLPAIGRGRQVARRTQCSNNLRQIFVMLNVYADDWNGVLPPLYGTDAPPHEHWMVRLQPYGLRTAVMFCPTDPNYGPSSSPLDPDDRKSHSYVLNGFPTLNPAPGSSQSFWAIANPSEVVLMAEKKHTETDYYLALPPEDPYRVLEQQRHVGRSNYLFVDGHISSLPSGKSLAPQNLWSLPP
jgi:prepilin-type processing-associated H-X9-DG protein